MAARSVSARPSDMFALEPALEKIAAGDERANLPIDDAPLQHTEAAVRMHIRQTIRSHDFHNVVDSRSDELRTLHLVVLDVDDADTELDSAIEIVEHLELVVAAACELEHEMIGAQPIEKRHHIPPESAQHRLATVVAETEVDGLLVQDADEHVIDRVARPLRILRIADDARFVQLHGVGFNERQLAA